MKSVCPSFRQARNPAPNGERRSAPGACPASVQARIVPTLGCPLAAHPPILLLAASVASLLCSSLPRTTVAISGLSFRALPPSLPVSRFSLAIVSAWTADALRSATRTELPVPSRHSPEPHRRRVAVGPRRIGSLKRGASRTTRADSGRSCHRLARTSAWLGVLHPSLKGYPSTVRCPMRARPG